MSGTTLVDDARVDGIDSGRAWVVAGAALVINMIGFGIIYSFGSFFGAMVEEFDAGRGATAAVFSITTFLFFSFGLVSGPLYDRYGPRPLVASSAALIATGLVLTSRVPALWLGYLTYGVCVGVGVGLYLVPITAAVGGWFDHHRTAALGLSAAGMGLGPLIAAPMSDRLIEANGWRDSYVILAVIAAVGIGAMSMLMKRPPSVVVFDTQARSRWRGILGTNPFRMMFVSGLLMSLGIFVPFVFIVDYATSVGITSSRAAALIGVLGLGSVIGRLGIGAITVHYRTVLIVRFCLLIQATAYLIWLFADDRYWQLVVFMGLLGVGYGGFVALVPALTAEIFGIEGLGGIFGAQFVGPALGGLIGPIVAGIVFDMTGSYQVAIVGASVTAVAAWYVLGLLDEDPAAALAPTTAKT